MVERLFGIYIASSSKFIDECKKLAKKLEEIPGVYITRKWWDWYIKDKKKYIDLSDTEYYAHPHVRLIREFDLRAVRKSDLVIILAKDGYKMKGSIFEMGSADTLGIPIVVYGKLERSTMWAGAIFCNNEKELLIAINRWLG